VQNRLPDLTLNLYYNVGMKTERKSRIITISLPPEMATRARTMAKRESRTMSELFREAFRSYSAQDARRILDEIGEYAKTTNPHGYTEEDVPRLVKEVRAEMRAEKQLLDKRTARRA
jgi:metal-responsive CopG/Arc/MetJ family transcriptional regulator